MGRTAAALLLVAYSAMIPFSCESSTAADDGAPVFGPPVHRGRARASGPATRSAGAIYELASGARLVLPAGLPVGSGPFVFEEVHAAAPSGDAAEGFVPLGRTFRFDGALDATRAPLELSVPAHAPRVPDGRVLALAAEAPDGWRLLPARYDENARRLVARIPTPFGARLRFGLTPE